MKNIRVLIIDEHPTVCQALTSRLGAVSSVTVVGAMSNFSDGLRAVQDLHPDIILLELKANSGAKGTNRKLDPVAAISMLQEQSASAVIIVLTAYLDEEEREHALRAGARRYLLKRIDTAHLVGEIEAVAATSGKEALSRNREGVLPLLLTDGRANFKKAEDNLQEKDK